MENENDILALVMARLETHFARQSEFSENNIARMQSALQQAKEIQSRNKVISATLDRLEAANDAVHKHS